ncbi:hypothetical protein DH2020_011202 [Rehmannia glutinosa]|uniref:F-box domain-containing protein n=1 Tax=Rehmannia glutinosa TaxID=99300 RepID=A0ABR0XCT7_REHGL
MESLPDAIVQHILSLMSNAKDVASCKCVSKRWKDSMPYLRSLFSPKSFRQPYQWQYPRCHSEPNGASNLESLKLWGVLMIQSPKWDVFHRLKNLEIVGASLKDYALSDALRACPNLTHLLLLGCEGLMSVSIDNPHIEQCKLDFYGAGNCSLTVNSSKIESLEVQGCSVIRVYETGRLKNLSISNNSGRVYLVDFGKLVALETLSIRGVQWCWDAISKMLQMASEVDSRFLIPCLEKVVITVRSPLNAEQKMSTLDSLIKCAKNLRKMTIKILQMKSNHSSADDFFEDICRFRYMNRKIVSIE